MADKDPDFSSHKCPSASQEVKLLAKKEDREALDSAINELVEANPSSHDSYWSYLSHFSSESSVILLCSSRFGRIRYASLLFSQISEPNTYIWNTLIRGYCKAQLPLMGLSLARERVRMDEKSFVFALKACEQFLTIVEGKSVHCWICKVGFVSDMVVQNGLIHYYADHGCIRSLIHSVFDYNCKPRMN